jgi:hypothetical protein
MRRALVVATSVAAFSACLNAQSVSFLPHTRGYFSLGFGSGSYTLTCGDPACANANQGGSSAMLGFGRHFGSRFRLEIGAQMVKNGTDNSMGSASIGGALYLVNNLFVRGAYASMNPTVDDATGAYSGRGGGYLVGAGYDLLVNNVFAISPYVTLGHATIASVERRSGAATTMSAGTVKTMQFGLSVGYIGGVLECTTKAGARVKVLPKYRSAAESCLNEVRRRPDAEYR